VQEELSTVIIRTKWSKAKSHSTMSEIGILSLERILFAALFRTGLATCEHIVKENFSN